MSSELIARKLTPQKSVGLVSTERQSQGTRFETIFLRHYGRVYRLLYRILGSAEAAEDAAQEVFLRLYRQEAAPTDEDGLNRWLARVATNHALNLLRAQRRQQDHLQYNATLDRPATATREDSYDPAQVALAHEALQQVNATLDGLSDRARAILILRHRGFSYAEIATALEIAPGSVGTLLARAERDFRQRYTTNEQ